MLGHALDDHDGVIDHDADAQHQRKQGQEIHAEPEHGHRREGSDDGDGHGGGGHHGGSPVLQKHQDHDQHQHASFEQRLVDLVNRRLDEHRGVEGHVVGHALREILGRAVKHVTHGLGGVQRIGRRQLIDGDAGRRLVVEVEVLVVVDAAQLQPRDVFQPRDAAVGGGEQDQLAEVFGAGHRAVHGHRQLLLLAGRRGRHADLAGADALVLLADDVDDAGWIEPALAHLRGVEPHAHRIVAHPEHLDVGHAGQSGQPVTQLQAGVVAEKQRVVLLLRRRQRDDLQDRGGLLQRRHALLLHRIGQRRHGDVDAVLHGHLRLIGIGAHRKTHGQRVVAAVGGIRLHVQHAFDAVDLLLDHARDLLLHRCGAGPRIAGGDLDGGRCQRGVLLHRQVDHRHGAQHQHQDGAHIGQHRPLDEKLGDQLDAPCWSGGSVSAMPAPGAAPRRACSQP